MSCLDDIDKRLLAALQKDAQLTSDQLGDHLGLSASQAGRRQQKLDSAGCIAQLDPAKLGLSIQAFVQVHLSRHSADHSKAMAQMFARQLEIFSA